MCSRRASKYKSKFCFVSKHACINCMRSEDKMYLAPFFFSYWEKQFNEFSNSAVVFTIRGQYREHHKTGDT